MLTKALGGLALLALALAAFCFVSPAPDPADDGDDDGVGPPLVNPLPRAPDAKPQPDPKPPAPDDDRRPRRPWRQPQRLQLQASDAKPEPAVDLLAMPEVLRKHNIAARGLGCCVFRSIDYAASWQNIPAVTGMPEWMVKSGIEGGGYPSKVAALVKRICAERSLPVPVYWQYEGSDYAPVIERVLKTGRVACVTWMDAHMLTCVSLDNKWCGIVDNNHPDRIDWHSREDGLAYIGGRNRRAWVLAFAAPPPPPPPRATPDAKRPHNSAQRLASRCSGGAACRCTDCPGASCACAAALVCASGCDCGCGCPDCDCRYEVRRRPHRSPWWRPRWWPWWKRPRCPDGPDCPDDRDGRRRPGPHPRPRPDNRRPDHHRPKPRPRPKPHKRKTIEQIVPPGIVNWTPTEGEHYFRCGVACTRREFEADFPDDSAELHVTFIGGDKGMLSDEVVKLAPHYLVQVYKPDNWALACGFVTAGAQVYFQDRAGHVLFRDPGTLHGVGLIDAVRKRDPAYKPDADPQPKPPAPPLSPDRPGPNPDGDDEDAGSPLDIIREQGSMTWLVIAAALGAGWYYRREQERKATVLPAPVQPVPVAAPVIPQPPRQS